MCALLRKSRSFLPLRYFVCCTCYRKDGESLRQSGHGHGRHCSAPARCFLSDGARSIARNEANLCDGKGGRLVRSAGRTSFGQRKRVGFEKEWDSGNACGPNADPGNEKCMVAFVPSSKCTLLRAWERCVDREK